MVKRTAAGMSASFLETWSARQVNSVLMENTLSQDEYKPQCSGLGVIDCTGECAGTEEEFKKFMDGITMWVEDKD